MRAADIAQVLDARRCGQGWMARCPVHDDREPSFSISEADDGTVLVHCFGGCPQEDVIAALKSRGLWPERQCDGPKRPPDHVLSWARTFVTLAHEAMARGDRLGPQDRADLRHAQSLVRKYGGSA